MAKLPQYFFINGHLVEKIAVIRADSSVLVFDFQDMDKYFLPLVATKKNYKKAYTYSKAADLIGTTTGKLREIVEAGLHPAPEQIYDLSTLEPKTPYFSEDQLIVLRNICYDLLPKNKYGIPRDNRLVSAEELLQAMRLTDDRDFVRVDSDGVYRIYRA